MEFAIFFSSAMRNCISASSQCRTFATARACKPKALKANTNIPQVFIKIRVFFWIPLPRSNLLSAGGQVSKSPNVNLLTKVQRAFLQDLEKIPLNTLSSIPAVSLNCFVEISHHKQTQLCQHIQGDTFPKQQTITGNMAATVLINHN